MTFLFEEEGIKRAMNVKDRCLFIYAKVFKWVVGFILSESRWGTGHKFFTPGTRFSNSFFSLVPRFNTCYKKDSVAYRGSVLWNTVLNRRCEKIRLRRQRTLAHTDCQGRTQVFCKGGDGGVQYMQLAFVLERR